MRVLVVGAGPTGLTAGVELARQGVEVDVIDKRNAASTWSRSVGIQPLSLELLQASGVSDALLSEGTKFHSAKLYRNQSLLTNLPFAVPGEDISFVLGLAQDRTETHLRDALEKFGGRVHYGLELLKLEQTDKFVSVLLDRQEQALSKVEFDYVIGADGTTSTVRDQIGIAFPGFDLPGQWSIADVDAEYWTHPDAFTLCQVDRGNVAIVAPLEENRYRVIATAPDALATLPLRMDVTNVRRAGAFSISIRMAETYQKGRVFLAGDAAHCHSPVGGRGMNLGIADAADLAQRLVDGTGEGYSKHRRAAGKEIIGKSEQARKVITSTNPVIRLGTYVTLKLINSLPFLQRRLAKVALFD